MSASLYQCNWCHQVFGTQKGYKLHKTGTEAYPKCRSKRRLKELGMWQGFNEVWWTTDLGLDDDLGFLEEAPETRIEASAQVPQKTHLRVYPRVRGFGAPLQTVSSESLRSTNVP